VEGTPDAQGFFDSTFRLSDGAAPSKIGLLRRFSHSPIRRPTLGMGHRCTDPQDFRVAGAFPLASTVCKKYLESQI